MNAVLITQETKALLIATLAEMDRRALSSAECDDIDALIQDLQVPPAPVDLLKAAKSAGAVFSDCAAVFGVPKDKSLYAIAAERLYAEQSNDDIELDDNVVVCRTEYGAFVSGWLFVRNEEAKVDTVVEEVEKLLQCFDTPEGAALLEHDDELALKHLQVYELFLNHGDTISEMAYVPDLDIAQVSKQRFAYRGIERELYPSQVMLELAAKASSFGFEASSVEFIGMWVADHGLTLDASLTTVSLG